MRHNAQLFSDFLVIGGGIAGLTFAIKASEFGTVTVLTKAGSSEANTAYAQGGIASVWSVDDSFESHIEDTLRAGAGLCDRAAVETIVREGPEAVRELIRLGTRFTRVETEGNEIDSELEYDLGQEGGHSHRRVLHAQDLTGREIMRALTEAAAARPNIRTLENHVAINLLVETPSAGKPGACWGVYALDRNTHEIRKVISRATMLATGGAGKVYLYTTNPDIASGDGVAMAYRAGAAVANLEFYQFHPTCLYHPAAKSFLISEALRGEGAILKLPDGTAFMKRYHPDAELAPRDVVARAIDSEMKRHGLDFVYLDLSHREADFIKRRFPNIFKRCLSFGYDLTRGPIPVVPAAHYMCGGVQTDLDGRTSIPRLVRGRRSCDDRASRRQPACVELAARSRGDGPSRIQLGAQDRQVGRRRAARISRMGSGARDSQRGARDDYAELGRDSPPDVELRRHRAQRPTPRARAAANPDGQGRDPQLLLGPSARCRHDRVAQPREGRRAGRSLRDESARITRPALQHRSSRDGRRRIRASYRLQKPIDLIGSP